MDIVSIAVAALIVAGITVYLIGQHRQWVKGRDSIRRLARMHAATLSLEELTAAFAVLRNSAEVGRVAFEAYGAGLREAGYVFDDNGLIRDSDGKEWWTVTYTCLRCDRPISLPYDVATVRPADSISCPYRECEGRMLKGSLARSGLA